MLRTAGFVFVDAGRVVLPDIDAVGLGYAQPTFQLAVALCEFSVGTLQVVTDPLDGFELLEESVSFGFAHQLQVAILLFQII